MHIILYFRSGTLLLYIQKPLTLGQGLTRNQWISVVQYSIVRALHSVMWFYGITLCGPFRSILVSQHYDIVIIAVLSSTFSGTCVGGPARTRGVFMFLAAIVALLFLDHDEEQLHSGDGRLFSNIVSWLGLADHKLGVLLLVLVLLLQAGVNILGKRLSQTIGGIKRLNSLSSPLEGVVLLPETLFLLLTQVVATKIATLGLTSSSKLGAKGSLVGYSSSGLPLYNFTNSALHHTSRSILRLATGMLKQVLMDNNSRRIFYFLCLNLSFTMVEFMYGVWTNSLGLISDGFHMLFDCSALVMGLLASVMARWKPSKTFSYGHSHTHGSDNHHDNSHGSHGHSHNANMQGHYYHWQLSSFAWIHDFSFIMVVYVKQPCCVDTEAQTVGVIFSSILIDQFGWYVADPVCSIFIAVLIFLSVLPLLKHSALVLLLRTPRHIEEHIPQALNQVFAVEGIVSVGQPHFWQHSSKMCIGSLHIQASPTASEQNIIQQVIDKIKVNSIFKQLGFYHFIVQVEKQEFLTHMSGLSSRSGLTEKLMLVKAV
uniref:Cation efflux protein transmembrane domain-containing protein n=1 Tax=Timema bartmani TaxID=61472 RepID=A0A7R9ESP3_9NEOP|nr:unnamed protein product [Timema bartmani]